MSPWGVCVYVDCSARLGLSGLLFSVKENRAHEYFWLGMSFLLWESIGFVAGSINSTKASIEEIGC